MTSQSVIYKAAWRERTRAWATEILGGACVRCGVTENLQFDHIDATTKLFEISQGIVNCYSRARLLAELAKCQLLCRPCHRAKTVASGEYAGGRNKITDAQHGSWATYSRDGCRCSLCRLWRHAYRYRWVDARGNLRT